MLTTVIIFVAVLSLLVSFHEYGHFFTARLFGVKAEEFGFGFPPRIGGLYRNRKGNWRLVFGARDWDSLDSGGDESRRPAPRATIYSLNWLPIGGFVKIKGQDGAGDHQSDSFAAKSIWQRASILSAGVIMNLFLAWVLFSVSYLIGSPQIIDDSGSSAIISGERVVVSEVFSGSIADAAGLRIGDVIEKVGDRQILTTAELQEEIAAAAGQEVSLALRRGEEPLSLAVVPALDDSGRAVIGIGIFSEGLVRYPFWSAWRAGALTTISITKEIFITLGQLLSSLFSGQAVGDQFAGPVGIASLTREAARLGWSHFLQFTALLSVNLAVINILPLPALDGGRIVLLLLGGIFRRPLRKEAENFIHNAGLLLLMLLVIFITYQDILKLFSKN